MFYFEALLCTFSALNEENHYFLFRITDVGFKVQT